MRDRASCRAATQTQRRPTNASCAGTQSRGIQPERAAARWLSLSRGRLRRSKARKAVRGGGLIQPHNNAPMCHKAAAIVRCQNQARPGAHSESSSRAPNPLVVHNGPQSDYYHYNYLFGTVKNHFQRQQAACHAELSQSELRVVPVRFGEILARLAGDQASRNERCN